MLYWGAACLALRFKALQVFRFGNADQNGLPVSHAREMP